MLVGILAVVVLVSLVVGVRALLYQGSVEQRFDDICGK